MKRFIFLLVLLFPFHIAFADFMKIDNFGNPVLNQYSEEGFVDCVFRVAERNDTPTHYVLKLRAVYKGEIVGFTAKIVRNIQAGLDSNANLINDHIYRNGVVFSRSGVESDRLISVLASLYDGKDARLKMKQQESFTAIALHQGEFDMKNQAVKLKLFGRDAEPIDDSKYNESFFNIDLKTGLVFWNEKDQEYRFPLIRALAE